MTDGKNRPLIHLSSKTFLLSCVLLSFVLWRVGLHHPFPSWLVALEVLLTVLALFIFGSIRIRLDKNALTYGAGLVIGATAWEGWWQGSLLKQEVSIEGFRAVLSFVYQHFLTLHGLEQLVHADTMLFILGLTFFVSAIAQTRLLETVSFIVLRKTKGSVVWTVALLAAIVSFSSGILDGVSMIGLMIRTLVILLFLAKVEDASVIYAVIVSTVITTVCGMWLAYGEPPNLIMKTNLQPHLTNSFFLRYCLPVAVGSYFIVLFNVRKRLRAKRVIMESLDVLDLQTADVRYLQASRHGQVLTPVDIVEDFFAESDSRREKILKRLHSGEPLGLSMVHEAVPENKRLEILGHYVSEELAPVLDHHYRMTPSERTSRGGDSEQAIYKTLHDVRGRRVRSQWIGALSFIPFIGLLVFHAINHAVPLFLASFAGFCVAFSGVFFQERIRRLVLKDAFHEYAEYLFLFPLFFSIFLLQTTGFFSQLSGLLITGIEKLGVSLVALIQYVGAVVLSAMLDNNVVADFSSRALQGLEVKLIHLFSMAQIAGYAVGGCWTHIGSAQSVVAYAFIRKEVNEHYTPFQWIKAMTPIVFQMFIFMILVVFLEGWFLN